MFETHFPQRVTKYAAHLEQLQDDYLDCWQACASTSIQAAKGHDGSRRRRRARRQLSGQHEQDPKHDR